MLNKLQKLGLSDNEAKVYMAMLELGPATMLEISAKAGINRPTAYVQVETLKKMGLVTTQIKGKKHLFMAESPDQLEFFIEEERKEIEEKKKELANILPELITMFNLYGDKPQVKFFEGKEGLIAMQNEFLKAKDQTIIGITSMDDLLGIFPKHLGSYSPKRVEKGTHAKLIYTSSKGAIAADDDEKMLRKSKYIDPNKLPFNLDITVYDDIVAIAALKGKLSGAIIKHKEIANSFRNLLNLIWNIADKL